MQRLADAGDDELDGLSEGRVCDQLLAGELGAGRVRQIFDLVTGRQTLLPRPGRGVQVLRVGV